MSEATIVALYDRYESANQAVMDIIQAGAAREKISLLANSLNGDHPSLTTNPSYAREELDTKDQAQPAVVTGAEFGIGVGGIFGVLLGTGAIVIPGIGPLIAAGALATIAAGAATGGVVGGAIGLLTGQGISNADSHLYAEGIKRGGTLVTVVADDSQLDTLRQIFKTHGAVTAFRGRQNRVFDVLAAIQRRFYKIEKKQRAVAALHRERKQEVQQQGKCAAGQQDQNCIPK